MAWVPVTDPQDLPSAVFNGLEIRDDILPDLGRVSKNSTLPFLEKEMEVKAEEPVEVSVKFIFYFLIFFLGDCSFFYFFKIFFLGDCVQGGLRSPHLGLPRHQLAIGHRHHATEGQ